MDNPSITVSDFIARAPHSLELKLIAGADGAEVRRITLPRIQKLGLALAGFRHYLHPGRVQIIGQSEISYLTELSPEARHEAIRNLELERISCALVTKDLSAPPELVEAADDAKLPLLQTPLVSSEAITHITLFLQKELAPCEVRHGVLLDLYGIGVLIEGRSGIGKSECALDLIVRGHRLIADDQVEVRRVSSDTLVGNAPELLREYMEIRGLGIINIRELYGVSAISESKEIELSIKLERWSDAKEVERLGIDAREIEILGLPVPHVLLPVSPGRNLSTLVETAVRVHLLRARGHDAARELVARHDALMRDGEYEAFDDAFGEDAPTFAPLNSLNKET